MAARARAVKREPQRAEATRDLEVRRTGQMAHQPIPTGILASIGPVPVAFARPEESGLRARGKIQRFCVPSPARSRPFRRCCGLLPPTRAHQGWLQHACPLPAVRFAGELSLVHTHCSSHALRATREQSWSAGPRKPGLAACHIRGIARGWRGGRSRRPGTHPQHGAASGATHASRSLPWETHKRGERPVRHPYCGAISVLDANLIINAGSLGRVRIPVPEERSLGVPEFGIRVKAS
jgi:hypothetical protein